MVDSVIENANRLTESWYPLRPHSIQNQLWNCKKQFVAVPAGRGSGKTELAKRKLVMSLVEIKDHSDPRYCFAAPTERQAKRIAWDHLNSLVPKTWVRKIDASELVIHTVMGSSLWVAGMDKPQRIEGVQWDGIVVDESCDQKPNIFKLVILPMLAHRHGWCWRIGVPKRQGTGATDFKKFFQQCLSGKIKDGAAFTWPSDDILTPDQLESAREILDSVDYMEQFGGIFQETGGGVFHCFDPDYNIRPCEYNKKLPIIIGSDFNVDPMAWVMGHRYADRIEWFDELWRRNTNTEECLKILNQRYKHHRSGFQFYGDATGSARKTSASESDYAQILNHSAFKVLGRTVHYPRSNPRILDRFASCNAMFRNAVGTCRMFIDAKCERLIEDVEARSYKPGKKIPADEGIIGHPSDAMGYVVHRLYPVRIEFDMTPVAPGILHYG